MAVLTAADIPDMIVTTEKQLGELKFAELGTERQRYPVMERLLKKRINFDSGTELQWPVRVDTEQTVRMVGLRDVDRIQSKSNVMDTASVPWRNMNAHYAVEERELAMNRAPRKIVDILVIKRSGMWIDIGTMMTSQFWNKPTDSTDKLNAMGIPYWVPKNNAGLASQFDGGNPAGFADGAGGIDSVAVPRWASGAAGYTTNSKDDLWAKVREFMTKCHFMPQTDAPLHGSKNPLWALYSNYAVIGAAERILENQNDSLGNDIASKDGKVIVRGIPVEWEPYLDADSTNPVWGLDWGQFQIVFMEGWYFKETRPVRSATSHTQWVRHFDSMFNFLCRNRRHNFVVSI